MSTAAEVRSLEAMSSPGGRAAAHLLAGRVEDANGEPLIASHAAKGVARYRCYVSRSLQTASSTTGLRIPAAEL